MQHHSNGEDASPAPTTIYLVHVERQQAGDIAVELAGPVTLDGFTDAMRIAHERLGAGEAIAWATVGTAEIVGLDVAAAR